MGSIEKKHERLVAADEDNVPHLENMENVQGSNKHRNDVEQKTDSQE